MASKAVVSFLVAMMLVTGVCNTLLTKYQDNQCVRNCNAADPAQRKLFNQPVVQTAQMFIGEMGCWLVLLPVAIYRHYFPSSASEYRAVDNNATDDEDLEQSYISEPNFTGDESANPALKALSVTDGEGRVELKGWKTILLALPAVCDIIGTTLMNIGLTLVAASIYQMTRGALVLFVGLFSVLFLKRHLRVFQWFALFTVVVGVMIVGLAGALYKEHHESLAPSKTKLELMREVVGAREDDAAVAVRTVLGVLLIAGAQVFTATQFVTEEFILEKYALEPLKVVGWEGLLGFAVTLVGMIVMHLVEGRTAQGQYGYFDAVEGWREITSYRAIWVSSLLIMVSIGGFNFFGLSVTRTVSATSRSTIDTCRTLFIWIVSLSLGWETFKWLQVLGFVLLVYGTFLFNGIVRPPLKRWAREAERVEELLPEEPVEHM